MKDFAKSIRTGNADLGLRPIVSELTKDIAKIYEKNGKDREKTKRELIEKHHFTEKQAEEVLRKIVGNSKVGNAKKTFSGKYIDIYDDGQVVVKEGWAFGERFNENTFGRWIDEQIRAKEKTLQECKQMKREFESNY